MQRVVILCLILGAVLALPAYGSDASCHRLSLDPVPTWTYSGAWSSDGRLLLVDIGRKAVRAYDPYTGTGEIVWQAQTGLDQPGGPALIQNREDRVLLEVHDALHTLGPEGLDDPIAQLVDVSGLAGLRSIHSWSLGENHVLAYGDHYHPVAGWRPVLVTASLDEPSRVRILETLSFEGPDRTFYTNSQSYLAMLGNRGYVLRLTPRPHLLEIDLDSGERRTLQLPAALSPRVRLPPASGLETLVAQQAALASTHRPAAVYAHDGLLYVLSRHPRSTAPWRLTAFDPDPGRALSATALPSKAEHVVLVPGDDWALIEKGPFHGYGQQEILGALVLPSEEITGGGHACSRATLARH